MADTEYERLDQVYEIKGNFSTLDEVQEYVNTPAFYKELTANNSDKAPGIAIVTLRGQSVPEILFLSFEQNGIPIDWCYDNQSKPITLESIKKESNTEKRRLLIMKYGLGAFEKDMGFKTVSCDAYGTLMYVKNELFPTGQQFVKVINGTPEPVEKWEELKKAQAITKDGRKYYYCPVPLTVKTAKEGIAFTWDIDPDILPDKGWDFES